MIKYTVTTEKVNKVTFQDLEAGDTFVRVNTDNPRAVYVKTTIYERAVNLRSGRHRTVNGRSEVIPLETDLHITCPYGVEIE